MMILWIKHMMITSGSISPKVIIRQTLATTNKWK